jgi:hypothetical protein
LGAVNGAESLHEVPTVEISVVANNTRELARPFSSGGRSIAVGDTGELDGLVSEALLVGKCPAVGLISILESMVTAAKVS